MKVAALFSGQGSQYPGMGQDLWEASPPARQVYECAGDIFGWDVAAASFAEDAQQLASTKVAQAAIFTHSVASLEAARCAMPPVMAVAGHSLGEFAALYCAGAFSLEDAMRIVRWRGEAMEQAAAQGEGAMCAVLGCEGAVVEQAAAAQGGDVWAVNYNLPTQTVISGRREAVEQLGQTLADQGAKVVPLAVAGAFHTPLMASAAQQLQQQLAGIAFAQPKIAFYSNLTGDRLAELDYPTYFAQQMVSPVRFVQQVSALVRDGVTQCVEFGPKKTVATLAKKNARQLTVLHVENVPTLDKAKQQWAVEE